MPKIEPLFTFSDIWTVAGPFIISTVIALIAGIIFVTILNSMGKGLLRQMLGVLLSVAIIFIFIVTLQITANLWGIKS